MSNGIIQSIAGPVVTASNMTGCFMFEVCYVGNARLIGEIIQLKGDLAVIQVYEDTSGLAVNDVVYKSGRLLSVHLGPGLLSSVYDGIQRPLEKIASLTNSHFIPRGVSAPALDLDKKWTFKPVLKVGDLISVGDIFGVVPENELLECRIMLPSYGYNKATGEKANVPGGRIVYIAPAATNAYTVRDEERILEVEYEGATYKYGLAHYHPVRSPKKTLKKLPCINPLITGQRTLDGLFPLAIGATAAIPGGFGCGKTVVSQSISKYGNTDVIVYIGCGERGNEMAEVLTDFPEMTFEAKRRVDGKIVTTTADIFGRTVLVANTSNMPVAAREASIYTGITISEFFRDQGYNVTLLADSTSRWAEALREISGRLGGIPGEGGYPADLTSKLSHFYERAGRVICLGNSNGTWSPENIDDPSSGAIAEGEHIEPGQRVGSVSIIGAVSPAAGDLSDAVAVSTLAIVQVFWGLSKTLAKRKHFPSVDWLVSYSRAVEALTPWYMARDPQFLANKEKARSLLQTEVTIQETAQLVGYDSLDDNEKLILDVCNLIQEGFLQQNSYTVYDRFCPFQKTTHMLRNIVYYYELCSNALKQGHSYAEIKSSLEQLITSLYRMKFIDTNTNGVEYGVTELNKLHEQLTQAFDSL
ncbi:Vacuolar ATP synthase catalytic subunit A [Giardia muris]|uniref:H(+)-transporting two-sector ATPase n=2 Tax=Giardia muris TaxID=5742 RepID=A0A4Z1T8E4_GIAMU|nr:Vacuolar ATP synthase catalytic subunit A [Giardia muris]|eukprot:TNJ30393.1 Vacuolar ATP synthase catalytic subunit A [Giardia muris]